MKLKKKIFEQHLYHEIDDEEKAEEYRDSSLPLIGLIVMYFNGLEKSRISFKSWGEKLIIVILQNVI